MMADESGLSITHTGIMPRYYHSCMKYQLGVRVDRTVGSLTSPDVFHSVHGERDQT